MKEEITMMDKLNPSELLDIADNLEKSAEGLREYIRNQCRHDVVYEIYNEKSSRPIRVCPHCGYSEEGWGCGYYKLATKDEKTYITENRNVIETTNNKYRRFITKLYTQSELDKIKY